MNLKKEKKGEEINGISIPLFVHFPSPVFFQMNVSETASLGNNIVFLEVKIGFPEKKTN
jgi:hypothetical protein